MADSDEAVFTAVNTGTARGELIRPKVVPSNVGAEPSYNAAPRAVLRFQAVQLAEELYVVQVTHQEAPTKGRRSRIKIPRVQRTGTRRIALVDTMRRREPAVLRATRRCGRHIGW